MMAADIHADDLYHRLGLLRTATAQEIKRAYQKLLRTFPPERAPEEFKRIREAYETLSDARSRAAYDESPNPLVESWIRQASDAMDAQEYALAERYLQQVLMEAPDLHFIRNLLGLCFLYQDRPSEAIAQYEQLLATGESAAAWYGNLGHAYRKVERFQDAVRAFQRAIVNGEDVTSYYIGWADVLIDQKQFDAAAKAVERGIQHDGQVDSADLQYFTKLFEIRAYQRNFSALHADIARAESISGDADQRRHLAWKLGMLAQHLLRDWHFEPAITLSQAARRLHPEDSDYEALERLAKFLQQGRDEEAGELLRWHGSFQQGGWLAALRRDVESSMPPMREAEATEHSPPSAPPPQSSGNPDAHANRRQGPIRMRSIAASILALAGWVWLGQQCSEPMEVPPTINLALDTPGVESVPGSGVDAFNHIAEPARPAVSLPTGTHIVPERGSGYGELTVFNGTTSDAVVQLVDAASNRTQRAVYIRAKDDYKINGIREGTYRIQFTLGRDWDSEARRFLVAPFYSQFDSATIFDEIQTPEGVRYSVQEVTLHPVKGGTAQTRPMDSQQFVIDDP